MTPCIFEVVPRTERFGHGDEVVAWELWADRERTPYGWQGEFIDSFRTEEQANAQRTLLVERQALAQRNPAQLLPGDLVLAPLGKLLDINWYGVGGAAEFTNGRARYMHYMPGERSHGAEPWLVSVTRRDLQGREWEHLANCVLDDFGDLVEVAHA